MEVEVGMFHQSSGVGNKIDDYSPSPEFRREVVLPQSSEVIGVVRNHSQSPETRKNVGAHLQSSQIASTVRHHPQSSRVKSIIQHHPQPHEKRSEIEQFSKYSNIRSKILLPQSSEIEDELHHHPQPLERIINTPDFRGKILLPQSPKKRSQIKQDPESPVYRSKLPRATELDSNSLRGHPAPVLGRLRVGGTSYDTVSCEDDCSIVCEVHGGPEPDSSQYQSTFWWYLALRTAAQFFLASAMTMMVICLLIYI